MTSYASCCARNWESRRARQPRSCMPSCSAGSRSTNRPGRRRPRPPGRAAPARRPHWESASDGGAGDGTDARGRGVDATLTGRKRRIVTDYLSLRRCAVGVFHLRVPYGDPPVRRSRAWWWFPLRAEDDRQFGQAAQYQPVTVAPAQRRLRDGQPHGGKAAVQGGERYQALEPGQPGTQAVVNAVAEGQVASVGPGDVEGARVAVPGRVPVGRGQRDDHLGEGGDDGPAEGDV